MQQSFTADPNDDALQTGLHSRQHRKTVSNGRVVGPYSEVWTASTPSRGLSANESLKNGSGEIVSIARRDGIMGGPSYMFSVMDSPGPTGLCGVTGDPGPHLLPYPRPPRVPAVAAIVAQPARRPPEPIAPAHSILHLYSVAHGRDLLSQWPEHLQAALLEIEPLGA
ncbi:hypothetical protein GGX14DRAFT_405352 [Mycena pura]|uniref:Uncharacterized protein n=1 Tax=Mycena pura TaxID=153505 RepID=A0AAD6Y4C6_9AGAR|nr:hypothetical protein GGX14DRAFT_405352 [Mycena pura]